MRDPTKLRGLYKEKYNALKNWYEALEKAIQGDALSRSHMRDYTKEMDQVHQSLMEEARHFIRWRTEAEAPAKSSVTLCAACSKAKEEHTPPTHVVHPTKRTVGIHDVRGMAVCPTCGAQWHRSYNTVKLVD